MADGHMVQQRALVFDLDGTLIDSRLDIALAVNFALGQLGRAPLPVAQIAQFVGNGAPVLLQKVAQHAFEGSPTEEQLVELSAHFHAYYREHPVDYSTVLPGARECLQLPDRLFALCTNKPRVITDLVIAGLGLQDAFDAVVGGGDTPNKKPHREPLDLVAQLLDRPVHELIMVGDGPQDVDCGRAVGAHTVGVRGGFLAEHLLIASAPDVILDDLTHLPAYLAARKL